MTMKRFAALLLLLRLVALPGLVLAVDMPPDRRDRVPYRRLTWADFRVDDQSPGLSAQTHTYTSFSYQSQVQGRSGDFTAFIIKLTFEAGFDRSRSWRRSSVPLQSEQLLTHEQGHFDITELKLRQLRRWKVEEMPIGKGTTLDEAHKDLKNKMEAMYKDEIADLERTQHRYDEETDHGVKRDVQFQWTQRLNRALQLLPPVNT